jgi:hypothetical protein
MGVAYSAEELADAVLPLVATGLFLIVTLERRRTFWVGWPALCSSLAQQSHFVSLDSRTVVYADLEVISSDQFSASDLLRLTAASLLITRTSAVIAAQPWDILSTAVRLWPQTVRR